MDKIQIDKVQLTKITTHSWSYIYTSSLMFYFKHFFYCFFFLYVGGYATDMKTKVLMGEFLSPMMFATLGGF